MKILQCRSFYPLLWSVQRIPGLLGDILATSMSTLCPAKDMRYLQLLGRKLGTECGASELDAIEYEGSLGKALASMPLKIETPLAEHVLGMGVGRGKEAFYLNALVHFLSKANKFTPVHFFAHEFVQAPPQSGLLGRARGHRDVDLIFQI